MCKYTFSGTFLVYFNWAKKVNANKAEIGKHVQLSENKSYVCEREKTRKIEKREIQGDEPFDAQEENLHSSP